MGESKTIIVDDDGGEWADYTTIHDAVVNASVNDTIRIFGGRYDGNVTLDIKLTLMGNSSSETIIEIKEDVLYPIGDDYGLHVKANESIISDLGTEVSEDYQILMDDEIGIQIDANNVSLSNIHVRNVTNGLRLVSNDATVTGCSIVNTSGWGIEVRDSMNVSISNVSMDSTLAGLLLSYTNYSSIWNLSIICADRGITSSNSYHNKLMNVSLRHFSEDEGGYVGFDASWSDNNYYSDIWIDGFPDNGIKLYLCRDNVITNCKVQNNTKNGIILISSDNNEIRSSTVSNNGLYGVRLDSPLNNNNVIYDNTFNFNEIYPQGYDERGFSRWDQGDDNRWYNGTVGNNWSDYSGVDDNGDGIGDKPYIIAGTGKFRDRYPVHIDVPSGLYSDYLIVDDDGGRWANFTKIRDALRYSLPGGQIRVYSGNYTESLLISHSQSIIGNRSYDTIVRAYPEGQILNVLADNFTVRGLRLSSRNDHNKESDAIRLSKADNSIIDQTNISHNRVAIQVYDSRNVRITDNYFSNNGDLFGIFIQNTTKIRILNNQIISHGIKVKSTPPGTSGHCSDILIVGNHIDRPQDHGIHMAGVNDTTIAYNTIMRSEYWGIKIFATQANASGVVHHNNMIDNYLIRDPNTYSGVVDYRRAFNWSLNGLGNYWSDYEGQDLDEDGIGDDGYLIEDDHDHEEPYSHYDDYPLMEPLTDGSSNVWYVDDDWGRADFPSIQDAIDFASIGDTILVNTGVFRETLYIDKQLTIIGNGTNETIIDAGQSDPALSLNEDWIIIAKMTITNSSEDGAGIEIHSNLCKVSEVSLLNHGVGIISFGNNNQIERSEIFDIRDQGILFDGGHSNTVRISNIGNATTGVQCQNSEYIHLSKNHIENNRNNGINLLMSSYVNINENNISTNYNIGILIRATSDSNVTNNVFESNQGYGAYVDGINAQDNRLFLNKFINNNQGSTQAYDEVPNNEWSDGKVGNHWNDYTGHDADGDQIGEEPYPINGSVIYDGAEDPFPLMITFFTNSRPFATIGSIWPHPAIQNRLVRFRGNSFDADGDVIRYVWESSLDGVLYDGSSNKFERRNLSLGRHNITLYVIDDDDAHSDLVSSKLKIVEKLNEPPMAAIIDISPARIKIGANVTFKGNGTDTDGEIRAYMWTSTIDGQLYNGTSMSFTINWLSEGNHTITLSVMDNNNSWSGDTVGSVEVFIPRNIRPTSVIVSMSPNPAPEFANVTLNGSGSDGDGNISGYRWSSSLDGLIYNGSMNVILVNWLSPGNHTIYFAALDDNGTWSVNDTAELDVIEHINELPYASIIEPTSSEFIGGMKINFIANATDPDGRVVKYIWESNLSGVLYDGIDESISIIVPNGTHHISLTVIDNEDGIGHSVSVSIDINGVPWIRSIDVPNHGTEGIEQIFKSEAIDDSSVVRYQWNSSLDGPIYDGDHFAFVPKLTNGTHDISLTVMDDEGVWSPRIIEEISINGIPIGKFTLLDPIIPSEEETISVHFIGRDDGSIVRYSVHLNGSIELFNGSKQNFIISTLGYGHYSLSLQVVDDNGFINDADTLELHINSRPTVNITVPLNGGVVDQSTTVYGSAMDIDGNVTKVYLSIDCGNWILVDRTDEWSYFLNISDLTSGLHTITVRCYDGYHYSDNHTIELFIEKSASKPRNEAGLLVQTLPWIFLLITAVFIALMFIVEGMLYATTGIVIALYSTLKKETIADQTTRGRIISYIGKNPGVHFSKIKADLKIHNGNLTYHLKILEKQMFIKSASDSYYKRFYPHGYKIPSISLTEIENDFVLVISANSSITQKELIATTGKAQSTVAFHLERLRAKGVIKKVGLKGWSIHPDYIQAIET